MLDKAPFLIKPCVEQTINLLKPLAKKRGNILLSHVAGNVPAEIIGDRGRFSQIITNLIGNALKFTEWGKVEVVLRYDQEKNFIHCEVKDTGIGIPTNKQHKIFERFTQGDPSITQKYGGTGLGLAITKRLVVMLGGEIDFESEENVGTRFWFTLPVVPDCLFNREAAPPLSTSSSPNAIALPQRMEARMGHILIAEDHPVNQLFLIALLKKFGFAMIDVAENGLEAMKKIRQKAEGWKAHPYNIIFMDCKMPEQDGYETTRQIRAYESKTDHHAHTPIIAMTANAMAGDREICFAAGMDEYISKPLSPEHLKEILKKWFVFPEEAATIPVATVEHNAPPLDFSRLSMVTKTDKGKAEFLALFFSLTRKSLDAMQATLHNNDFPQWQHAAHSLKGASANMGMTRLERLCFQAEQAVDITALERDALLQLIKRELEYIKTYLRQSHPHLLREES